MMSNTQEPFTELDAKLFARSWVDAWNSHDPSRIAAHYSEDVEYHSPFVARLSGGDALHGRTAVEEYAAAALARYPELCFGPEITVATGAGSIALVYRSVEDLLAVETLVFDKAGMVARAHCHYRSTAPSETAAGAPQRES
jgi:nuclear transport factor 2 (NTF2) superfamily protein